MRLGPAAPGRAGFRAALGTGEYSPPFGVFWIGKAMGVRSGVRGALTAGERDLLDRLVRELTPRLVAYIRRVYGSAPDAEDIVAETFCRAAGNMAALRTSTRRDLYLLTTVRNLCRDGFRRRRPTPTPDERLEQVPHGGDDAPDRAADEERRRALRAAVAELPESLREIVVLRLASGLKFEEIAELLHIPLGTALSRMHAAIQRLREMLGPGHGS